jgi:hypothetical protein
MDQGAGVAGDPPSFSQRALSALAAFCLAAAFAHLDVAHTLITTAAAIPNSNSDPNPMDLYFMEAGSHDLVRVVISTVHVVL